MENKNELGHMYYDENKQVVLSQDEPNIKFTKERHRASVVVIDKEGRLAFGKYTTGSGDILIAGGGVEEGETLMEALHREAREELGCEIQNIRPLGVLFQYAEYGGMEKQHYHGFFADIQGEKFEPSFTERELRHGLSVVWLTLEESLDILDKQRKNGGTKTSQLFLNKIVPLV